jgi:hypothetical protein
LRWIKYYDQEQKKELIFLTNSTVLEAKEIACFISNAGKLKSFFMDEAASEDKILLGTTLNAVKIQIYCAIIAYCMVAIIGNTLKVGLTIYEILQILSISLLDKSPIREILTKCDYKDVKEQFNNQLLISGF